MDLQFQTGWLFSQWKDTILKRTELLRHLQKDATFGMPVAEAE
jgi:hypothetical protein